MSKNPLPAELLVEIFGYLDYKTLKSLLTVNKRFYDILSRDPETSCTALDKALFRDCLPDDLGHPRKSQQPPSFDLHPFLQSEGFEILGVYTDEISGFKPYVTGSEVLRNDGKYDVEALLTRWLLNKGGKYLEENATSPATDTLEFEISLPMVRGPGSILSLRISQTKSPMKVIHIIMYRIMLIYKLYKAIEEAHASGAITISIDHPTLDREMFLDTLKWLRERGEPIPEGLGTQTDLKLQGARNEAE